MTFIFTTHRRISILDDLKEVSITSSVRSFNGSSVSVSSAALVKKFCIRCLEKIILESPRLCISLNNLL